ncbi:MAG: hypothetical protein ACI9YT_002974, partial [Halobacteriales archaeon]
MASRSQIEKLEPEHLYTLIYRLWLVRPLGESISV